MYPEGLEMSNIITILNVDLSFALGDFIKQKEIHKLFATKELLLPVLFLLLKQKLISLGFRKN